MPPIKSVSEYIQHPIFSNNNGRRCRGISNSSYALIPKPFRELASTDDDIASSNFDEIIKELPRITTGISKGIKYFKKRAIPFLSNPPANDLEWVFLAQHHGLRTPVLDWSNNPLVGLFFASQSYGVIEGEEPDGSVHFIGASEYFEFPNMAIDQILHPNFLDRDFTLYEPPFLMNRFSAQASVFMLLSLYRTIHIAKDENSMIIVDGASKAKIRDELSNLGINDYTLFPSLDTVAAEINETDKSFFK